MHRRFLIPVSLCAFAAFAGCQKGPQVTPVKGTVTMNGEPLSYATVVFQPENGRPSTTKTDINGHYELIYTAEKKGALVGKHTVRISTESTHDDKDGNMVRVPETVPARYNRESTLVREVTPGENVIDIELTSDETDETSSEERPGRPE